MTARYRSELLSYARAVVFMVQTYPTRRWIEPLHRNADCNADARISLVVHVISIVSVDNVNIVGLVPVVCPVAWPRINKAEPIAAVLEARKPANNHIGLAVDDERVVRAKVSVVTVVRDAVAVVATTLLPRAVV